MKMETVMEEGEEYLTSDEAVWNYEVDVTQLCRVCANPNEYLIPIFQGEGLEHELQNKISKHLPIKVVENDKLPTNLCYQCASTLIAWHDMVVGCLEANEKLRVLIKDARNQTDVSEVVETISTDACSTEFMTEVETKAEVKSAQSPQGIETISPTKVRNVAQQIKLSPTTKHEKTIVEEDIAPLKHGFVEEASSDSRYLEPFSAYHQTQIALRMQQWVSNGSIFCMLCGKMKENQIMLLKHLSVEHKIRCGHCRACFANEEELCAHLKFHDSKKLTKNEKLVECKKMQRTLKENKIEAGMNHSVSDETSKRKINLQFYYKKQLPETQIHNQSLPQKGPTNFPFRCDICSTIFSRRVDLKRHKIKQHSVEDLKSPGKENGSTNLLYKNKVNVGISVKGEDKFGNKSKSDIDDEIECMSYSDESVNSEDISRHLDIRTQTPPKVMAEIGSCEQNYSCSLCAYTCAKKQEMLSHCRKAHSTQKHKKETFVSNLSKIVADKPFSCSLCKNCYSRSSDLQRHVLKKHGGEKFVGRCVDSIDDMDIEIINRAKQDINGIIVYQCDVCGKNMITKRGFVRHARIHTGERPFTCHVCGKQYLSNTDLTRHLRCVHDGVKNYQCDICGRYFANKGTRNDHRRTHTGEKPFVCHVCGKSFPTPNSIYVHRRIHTDYFPHNCTSCDKKFRRRQQLIHHIRTHTGEKPHACDVCGKCFGVKDEVSRHRLTHSNEKPHVCPQCGICFGQKRYLSNHMKTHHARMI